MTPHQDTIREWRNESKCWDIASSVRPLVEEFWLPKLQEAKEQARAEVIKKIEDCPDCDDAFKTMARDHILSLTSNTNE